MNLNDQLLIRREAMKKKNDNVFSTKNLKIIFFYDRLRFYSFLTIILSSSVEESKVQSTHLCTGVSEMLSRGRETCSALKISIDGALSTLIGKWRKKPHFIFYYYQVAFIHLLFFFDFYCLSVCLSVYRTQVMPPKRETR